MDVNVLNTILIIIFFILAAPLIYQLFIKNQNEHPKPK